MLRKHSRLVLALMVAIVMLLLTLTPARSVAAEDEKSTPEYTSWDDLADKTVGMVTGATFESTLRKKCPDVGEVVYFSSTSDLIAALQADKIDAFINSMAVGSLAANRYDDLALFPEALDEFEIGIAFSKGSDLTSRFTEITTRLREDGTADELWDKWTAGDGADKSVPEQNWAGKNGTFHVAACQSLEPVS